jgi:hypothetical protein
MSLLNLIKNSFKAKSESDSGESRQPVTSSSSSSSSAVPVEETRRETDGAGKAIAHANKDSSPQKKAFECLSVAEMDGDSLAKAFQFEHRTNFKWTCIN